MRRAFLASIVVLAWAASGCVPRCRTSPPPDTTSSPAETSGFLDDYSLLRPGGPDELSWVYRNPAAEWTRYDAVLLEPVALWRSGRGSLDPVPQADLLRLAADFENALRRRLGESYRMVEAPGPGVMRIRLGITEARSTDATLDILTASRDAVASPSTDEGALSEETRRFIAAASIEGEIRDAQTDALLAAGIDRRARPASPGAVAATWREVDARLDRWVDRVCSRLESRTGR